MELREYMKLPYTRLVQEMNDETGHYFYGRILELDGCQTTAESLAELYEELNEIMESYLEIKLEHNLTTNFPLYFSALAGRGIGRLCSNLQRYYA